MPNTDLHPSVAGKPITIRPIRITDMEMEADFIQSLSPQTRHYRFLGGVSELSPNDLRRFCEVDGRLSMAFVATTEEDGQEVEIGVSRYAPNAQEDVREIAVTVSDNWQNKGVGTLLVKRLVEHAKDFGVRRLYSVDLADNCAMRDLASDLGMTATRDPDDVHQIIYSLDLTDDTQFPQGPRQVVTNS